MDGSMTKAQRADALLEAARAWQNGAYSGVRDDSVSETNESVGSDQSMGFGSVGRLDPWASAALSEVASMGYPLVNEDGTDCEKVATIRRKVDGSYVAWVRSGHVRK
jgi:hypothetical protein